LKIKECARLKAALELSTKGMQISRAYYCGVCMNGYYKKVAEKLKLYLDARFTDKGCEMNIRR